MKMEHHVTLDESQRQLVLMALAWLSLQRQGFDYALNEIALKLDNAYVASNREAIPDGSRRAKLYDEFRAPRLEELLQTIEGHGR